MGPGAPILRRRFFANSPMGVEMDPLADDPNQALGRFRHYLSLLARLQVEPRLRGKIDLSGVVQQALWEAHQGMGQLRGRTEAQTVAWLRQILIAQPGRRVPPPRGAEAGHGPRAVARRRIGAVGVASGGLARGRAVLAQARAIRQEQVLRLAEAVAELPDSQREAVELHHLRSWSLAETAEHLGLSKSAVTGLLHRGLKALRQRLDAG